MLKKVSISLPQNPKEKDYEDYICAYLQAGGLYLERNIIHRETEEILEIDILTSDFQKINVINNLIEIKGGEWGFNEIFKIKGWMVFLNYDNGSFIVQHERQHLDYYQSKALELNIDLINNFDLNNTKKVLDKFRKIDFNDNEIEMIRFSYLLERKFLKKLKKLKKDNPLLKSYYALDDYFYHINSGSFFSRTPIERINKLFKLYLKYKNITSKICNEIEGGDFEDEEIHEIPSKMYHNLFYEPTETILHFSLYVEHIARITILKCVIEYLILNKKGNYDDDDFMEQLEFLNLPFNISQGINELVKDKYFYLYPRFWQFFTYTFGGFILTDIKVKEYELLSTKTGIPIDEIPNAFNSFNKLFPNSKKWTNKIANSGIECHLFFPVSFSGIGANYRRLVYTNDKEYNSLGEQLPKKMTLKDLIKWNNLTCSLLK